MAVTDKLQEILESVLNSYIGTDWPISLQYAARSFDSAYAPLRFSIAIRLDPARLLTGFVQEGRLSDRRVPGNKGPPATDHRVGVQASTQG